MNELDEKCADPGKKRRSGGAGRGLGTGDGEGPLGVPVGKKGKGAGRRYVRGEDLAKWTDGSMESQIDLVESTLEMTMKGPIELIATRADGALFRAEDGTLHEAAFTSAPCLLSNIVVRPSTIKVYEDEALSGLVSTELRDLTKMMLEGEAPLRTRVRSLASLVKKGEPYTLGAAIAMVNEAMAGAGENHWNTVYEAGKEKIRTSLWGQIRELEGRIPGTAYAQLPKGRLPEFEPELRESLVLLKGALVKIVDEVQDLVFREGEEDANGAIRDSLLAEAQTLHGLLAKVELLLETRADRAGELERIAEAHDQWCGRARTMEVMAAHLVGRSQKGEARA